MTDSRRTFWPLVVLGIGSAVLSAVAASRQMIAMDRGDLSELGIPGSTVDRLEGVTEADGFVGGDVVTGDLPLAAALALVLLACWGVLLVTRGVVRLAVAWLGLVAAVGLLATLVVGYRSARDDYRDGFVEALGAQSFASDSLGVHPTGWFWVACVAAALACLVAALSVRHVRHWPAMGSRYDAPGAGGKGGPVRPETATTNELWKSIDEGHDPTQEPRP